MPPVFRLMLAVLLISATLSPQDAGADGCPANLNLGPEWSCMSPVATDFHYVAICAVPNIGFNSEQDAYAYEWAYSSSVGSTPGCPAPSVTRLRWADNEMRTWDFRYSCKGPYAALFPDIDREIEVENYSLYERTTYDASCAPVLTTVTLAKRFREAICPTGYRFYAGTICRVADSQTNLAKNLGDACPKKGECVAGNPINVGVGNKFQKERDFQGSGPNPLSFERYYNSAAGVDNSANGLYRFGASGAVTVRSYFNPEQDEGPKVIVPDAIGVSWRHTYQRAVVLRSNSLIRNAMLYRQDGRILTFTENGASWTSDADIVYELTELLSGGQTVGWEVRTPSDTTETYSVDGRLLSIEDRAGLTQTLGYDTAGRLATVTDHFGRQLTFDYAADPQAGVGWYEDPSLMSRIVSMTDPMGGVYQFGYDAVGNLIKVIYPDLSERKYSYGDSGFHYVLTGIIDGNDETYATYGYDAYGRARFSYHGIGNEVSGRVDVSYNSNHAFLHSSGTITYGAGTPEAYTQTTQFTTVTSRNLTSYSVRDGEQQSFAYDTNGNVQRVTDWNGTRTYREYNSRNLPTLIREAEGTAVERDTTITWESNYRLRDVVTEPQRTIDYDYYANGDLQKVTITSTNPAASEDASTDGNRNRVWQYQYNAYGQVTSIDGPRVDVADVTTLGYYDDPACPSGNGECGQLAYIVDAAGNRTDFNEYYPDGKLKKSTDPNGLVTDYEYDPRRRLTRTSVADGVDTRVTTYTYDGAGLLDIVTMPGGLVLDYDWTSAHLLKSVQDGLGNRIEYRYDAHGRRTAEDVRDGSGTLQRNMETVFDNFGFVDSITSGSFLTDYSFDSEGNLLAVVDPDQNTTTSASDALGRVALVTDALTNPTQYEYDTQDNLLRVIAPNGTTTDYEYDGLGNVDFEDSADRGLIDFDYDDAGNLTRHTDARGKVTENTYDALNRLTGIELDNGDLISLEYDVGTNARGRLTRITDTSGETRFEYNAFGQVTKKTQAIGGVTLDVVYGYDADGRLASMTYPSGRVVSYTYNAHLPDSLSLDSIPILTLATYEPFGPAVGWSWGNGSGMSRAFDSRGLMSSQTLAGDPRTLSYSDNGELTGLVDSRNNLGFGYDPTGRLETFTPSGLSGLIGQDFSYDGNGNRETLTEQTVEYDYVVGPPRPTLVLAPVGSPDTTIIDSVSVTAETFDWTVTMPATPGEYEFRLFDTDGTTRLATSDSVRVQAVPAAQSPEVILSVIQVEGSAWVTATLTGGPGNAQDWLGISPVGSSSTSYRAWTYVGSGQTSAVWTTTVGFAPGDYEWRLYENNGYTILAQSEPLSIFASPPPCGVPPCLDALSAAVRPATSVDARAEVAPLTYTNRLSSTSGPVAKSYSYDAAGNVISDGVHSYGYDDRGRLVSVDAGLASYEHNGQGQRVKKTVSGTSRLYVYDESGRVIGEYDASGTVIAEHGWFDGAPVVVFDATSAYYVHTDHLGTPRAITDGGTVLWRWESRPFGEDLADEDVDGDGVLFEYGLRFPGQVYDAETGLHYNYYRTYDPSTGRYLESDPIGLNGGLNTYAYVGNMPTTYSDRFGLLPSDYDAAEQIVRKYSDAIGVNTPDRYGIGLSDRYAAIEAKGETDLSDKDRPVKIHERYYEKCLSDAQANELLETYIHETIHFNQSRLERLLMRHFQDDPIEGSGSGIGDRIHDSVYRQSGAYALMLNREFQALRRELFNKNREDYLDPEWGYPEACGCLD